jgi:hypothetical protein
LADTRLHQADPGKPSADGPEIEQALEVLMRKILTAGLAALTIAGGAVATTAPADAAPYHGGGSWHGGGGGYHGGYGYRGGYGYGGAALAAGVIGFGLGAALSGPYNGYGYGYGYGPGYYASDYYGGPGYATCYAPRQVWSPYYHRYVVTRVPYAC